MNTEQNYVNGDNYATSPYPAVEVAQIIAVEKWIIGWIRILPSLPIKKRHRKALERVFWRMLDNCEEVHNGCYDEPTFASTQVRIFFNGHNLACELLNLYILRNKLTGLSINPVLTVGGVSHE